MSANEIPPMVLPGTQPVVPHSMQPGLKVIAISIPVFAVALLLWVWLWLVPAAVLLLAAGVMRLVRSLNGGVAFRSEVWITFAAAMVGFFPPLLASIVAVLFHTSGAVTAGLLGPLALLVPFALSVVPVFLASRRFVMWHKHPELLAAETLGESWRRGTDGHD